MDIDCERVHGTLANLQEENVLTMFFTTLDMAQFLASEPVNDLLTITKCSLLEAVARAIPADQWLESVRHAIDGDEPAKSEEWSAVLEFMEWLRSPPVLAA